MTIDRSGIAGGSEFDDVEPGRIVGSFGRDEEKLTFPP